MVPAAAIIVVVIVGLVVVFGGSGGSDDDAAKTPTTGSVDISDIDEPGKRTTTTATTTTTEAPTTTLPRTADGRVEVDSGSGITWTMAEAPDVAEITEEEGGDIVGERWSSTDGETTEFVEVVGSSGAFDIDAAIGELAGRYGGSLSAIEDSNFQPGARTASFRGTLDGTPVVGYIVAAQIEDQGVLVMTYREGEDLAGLYGTFVALPGSVAVA